MSDKKCSSRGSTNQDFIAKLHSVALMEAIRNHADPKWWLKADIQRENQAYLRRWGTYLRREARSRGLI